MEKLLNIILLLCILILLNQCIQKNNKNKPRPNIQNNNNFINNIERFNTDKLFIDKYIVPEKIEFKYNKRPIDKQFLQEQKNGVNLKSWYPNIWIEKFDDNGNPIYNSRQNTTGSIENFIEEKARFTYEFNEPKIYNMSGVADPNNFINNKGKTLQEVYDNSFVDYKKMVPKKTKYDTSQINKWDYEDERIENGGEISNGLYAYDLDLDSRISLL